MLGSIGFPELLLIFVVVLLVFGPGKLPEFARMLGKTLREFRQVVDEAKSTIDKEISAVDLRPDLDRLSHDVRAAVAVPELNKLGHDVRAAVAVPDLLDRPGGVALPGAAPAPEEIPPAPLPADEIYPPLPDEPAPAAEEPHDRQEA